MNSPLVPARRICRDGLTIGYADAGRAAYATLARHHYRDRPPATFCAVRAAWHMERGGGRRLIGVAVLAWPVGCLAARLRHFGIIDASYGERLRFANEHVRTIARVIVHPQFRALGVGRQLVRDLVDGCPTRYVEASATMGEFARVFAAAGLTQIRSPPDAPRNRFAAEPAYFILDRHTLPTHKEIA